MIRIEEASASDEALAFSRLLGEHKARPRLRVHGFHRWYGKLIPAIPAAAIASFTRRGDLVLDPFCGSGTVLVEARAAGRAARGHDVSPLATLLARVKSGAVDPAVLAAAGERCLARAESDPAPDWRDDVPAMPNREHYHPDGVARDLVRLLRAARAEEDDGAREWLLACVSAINRDVSNADTRHVFPGVSKRMKALIAEGWVGEPLVRMRRALRDRLRAAGEAWDAMRDSPAAVVVQAPVEARPPDPGSAALVVTNPPYVSSIRYVETFKLEAWWLGFVRSRGDMADLDTRCLGTERVEREPPPEDAIEALPSPACRPLVRDLARRGEGRSAQVVRRYVEGLARALAATAASLAPGGHAVVKLAPSRLRGAVIPTPLACAEILVPHGLRLAGAVDDAYDPKSRSLTASRNWYSGRMDSDALLVFRKEAP